jgi:hypothetical protein
MLLPATGAPPDLTPTRLLDHDFLAPTVAALAFVDGPSSVLPDIHQGDRGYMLERASEVASDGILARPFLSFFPSREALAQETPWRPRAAPQRDHQSTGRRVITSHLQVEQRVFLDSFDALAPAIGRGWLRCARPSPVSCCSSPATAVTGCRPTATS